MKRFGVCLSLVLLLSANQAMAWGDQGHRSIGAIAERLLKGSNAQKKLQTLLLPGETLESITLWADCAKGFYCGPLTQEMQDFTGANPAHNEYHYTNTPLQQTAYQPGGPGTSGHDIVQMLQQSIAVLQGRSDAQRNPHQLSQRQALLLVAHLVGDVHQPLHVGSAYIDVNNRFVMPQTQAQIDNVNIFDLRGDNNLLFADPAYDRSNSPGQPARSQNLHFFWDITTIEQLFKQTDVATADAFAQKILANKPVFPAMQGDLVSWPSQWVADGLKLAKLAHQDVQPVERKINLDRQGVSYSTWTVAVPPDYLSRSVTVAQSQIVLGGVHLAQLLQKIWP